MGASLPPPTPSVPPAPQSEKRLCPACQAEVQPDYAFCHNCGTLVQASDSHHSPTVRAGTLESAIPGGDETVQADATLPEQKPDL